MQGLSLDSIIKNLPILGMPLGALLILGFTRTPYDGTKNHEINTAIRNAVRVDCGTRARVESNNGDPAERAQRMQQLLDGCDSLSVESISVRGRFSQPVAQVQIRAGAQPVPEGFTTRYYKLRSRVVTWTASRATATSYHMKLF